MAKKIFIGIGSFLLAGVFIFCLVWTITNWSKVQQGLNGSNLYTYNELLNAKQEGREEALEDEEGYKALILTYKEKIANLTDIVNTLGADNEQIPALKEQILELQNEVTRLTCLLEEYSKLNVEAFEARFYIGEKLHTLKLVENGGTVAEFETPATNGDYVFKGWSLDKETIVDYTTIEITENKTFHAVYEFYTLTEAECVRLTELIFLDALASDREIVGYVGMSTTLSEYGQTAVFEFASPDMSGLYSVGFEKTYSTIFDLLADKDIAPRWIKAGTVIDGTTFSALESYLTGSNFDIVKNNIENLAGVEDSDNIFIHILETNRKGNYVATITYLIVDNNEIISGSVVREGSDYNLDTYADLLLKVFGGA